MPVNLLLQYLPWPAELLGAADFPEHVKPHLAPRVDTGGTCSSPQPTGKRKGKEGGSVSTCPQFKPPAPDAVSVARSALHGQAVVTAEATATAATVSGNVKPVDASATCAGRKAPAGLPVSTQPQVPSSGRAGKTRALDSKIRQAIQEKDPASLEKLLDAHPHAGRDPADRSAGACIRRFFRMVASWFDSDAFAWQATQAVKLLEEAVRAGNAESIRLLLARGMDLGKDKAMLEPALRIAMAQGDPEAVRLLLREILQDDPQYAKNGELVHEVARGQKANLLEVLVEEGMALPAQTYWQLYPEPIRDYLRSKVAAGAGACALASLSCAAQRALTQSDKLTYQFRLQLNGIRRRLNPAQNDFLLAGMAVASTLPGTEEKTYTDAGFSTKTAEQLVEQLKLNAGEYIRSMSANALARLDAAVAAEFARFEATGKIRPDLFKALLNSGMYAHVAFLVVAAFEAASQHPAWPDASVRRGCLLADALDQSAIDQAPLLEQAAELSGDAELFHSLLDPQLDLLVHYCRAQRAVESAAVAGQTLPPVSHP